MYFESKPVPIIAFAIAADTVTLAASTFIEGSDFTSLVGALEGIGADTYSRSSAHWALLSEIQSTDCTDSLHNLCSKSSFVGTNGWGMNKNQE